MPEGMEYEGLGPLLSARLVDLDLLWTRAEQIGEACCGDDREVISVIAEPRVAGWSANQKRCLEESWVLLERRLVCVAEAPACTGFIQIVSIRCWPTGPMHDLCRWPRGKGLTRHDAGFCRRCGWCSSTPTRAASRAGWRVCSCSCRSHRSTRVRSTNSWTGRCALLFCCESGCSPPHHHSLPAG